MLAENIIYTISHVYGRRGLGTTVWHLRQIRLTLDVGYSMDIQNSKLNRELYKTE